MTQINIINFVVGPQEDLYSFPDVVIEADTYLDNYLRFGGRRTTIETEVGPAYVLNDPELSPEYFREFASFLLGGDFLWNDDVAQFFAFMGYINDLGDGYPLDFWKIKLRDNWIRNNFYRLSLYDENVDTPELLIQRGPYVGLVDMTDFFTPSTMSKPRLLASDLDVFKKVVSFDGNIILAGGALISFLMDYPRRPKDLDFFITSKDANVGEAKIAEILNNYRRISYEPGSLTYLRESEEEENEDRDKIQIFNVKTDWQRVVRTQNAITIGKATKYQVVLRLYTSPSEVVHGFDLDASGILYDGDRIWATQRAEYAIKIKTNYFDFARMSPTYGYRLAKYASRGFQVWMPRFDLNKVRWDLLRQIALDADDHNDPEISPDYQYWSRAPRWLPNVEDTNNMKEEPRNLYGPKVTLHSILKQQNPIDLILFAMYFNYLPSLNLSDYSIVRLRNKNYREYRVTREEELEIINRNFTNFAWELGEEPIEERDNWYEFRGPGYVVFTSSDVPQDVILNLLPTTSQQTGLPSKLQWKTQNPMQQLTGTFNPTTLKSLDEWFSTAQLYGDRPKPERRDLFGLGRGFGYTEQGLPIQRPELESDEEDQERLERELGELLLDQGEEFEEVPEFDEEEIEEIPEFDEEEFEDIFEQ